MKVLFYTNCVNWSIRYYLSRHYSNIKYEEIPNYQFLDNSMPLNEQKEKWKLLDWPDVFIYQKIDNKYGDKSSDSILEKLPKDCVKISIPYPYNNVNWILFPPAVGDGEVGEWGDTTKYSNSESIIKYKRMGYSLKQILDLYRNGMMDFDIPGRVERYYNELTERDKILDVKMSDFIQEHARTHQLFFTQNHLTSILAGHLSNQIFEVLGTSYRDNPLGHPLIVTHIHGGSYTHSIYDQKYWNFQFPAKYSADVFIPVIKTIYETYN